MTKAIPTHKTSAQIIDDLVYKKRRSCEGCRKRFQYASLFVVLCIIVAVRPMHAQTAAELERLLETPAVTYADAAWLILSAAEAVPAGSSAHDAYQFALDHRWLPGKAAEDAGVTMAGASLLIMGAFKLKGGMLFSLSHSPRYAYRELTYRNLIQGRAYAALALSGERLLQIVGRALEYTGDGNL